MHVLWSAPFHHGLTRHGRPQTKYALPAVELVTAIHSVLAWRCFHGSVELHADRAAIEYLDCHGLLDLYSRIDSEAIGAIDVISYNPIVYYTIAKVFALSSATRPMAVIDMDLYLRQPIRGLGDKAEFVFSHFEQVGNDVYPPFVELPDLNAVLRSTWDERTPAANTSIAYFGSMHHRDAFIAAALAFARQNDAPSAQHRDVRPAFAEQRISVLEAVRLGVEARPVAPTTWLLDEGRWSKGSPSDLFHHTWLDKGRLARDQAFADHYLRLQIGELLKAFPESISYLEALVNRRVVSTEALREAESLAVEVT